jgi:hypothetical protein
MQCVSYREYAQSAHPSIAAANVAHIQFPKSKPYSLTFLPPHFFRLTTSAVDPRWLCLRRFSRAVDSSYQSPRACTRSRVRVVIRQRGGSVSCTKSGLDIEGTPGSSGSCRVLYGFFVVPLFQAIPTQREYVPVVCFFLRPTRKKSCSSEKEATGGCSRSRRVCCIWFSSWRCFIWIGRYPSFYPHPPLPLIYTLF